MTIKSRTATIAIISFCIGVCAPPAGAQQSTAPAFSTAKEASESLFQAVQENDEQSITETLGGPSELTTSSYPKQDKVARELFLQKYQQMHRLGREADGSITLYIGAENWPFPVPLVNQNQTWRFDPEAGKREILFRRIGENEQIAIVNCEEFAAAEERYAAASGDPTNSAPSSLVAKAARGSANADPVLLDGYYFRLVRVQAVNGQKSPSIALIAYPAQYRSSGVMTFAVTKHGVVYQKDLGDNTATVASGMATFHKDPTWRPAGE
jgi:hypothetical protein